MAEYTTTLFIPGLYGQYKAWKKDIAGVALRCDHIIQMGNVIGCNEYVKDGPTRGANEAILKFTIVQKSRKENWTQLIGPNEIAALNFPDEWTNDSSNEILRSAWTGSKSVFQVATVSNSRLVTHGGLTYGEWLNIGSPQTADEAAEKLNEKYFETAYQGPCVKLGDPPNYAANPIWADPVMEFFSSWITAPVACPFDQINGSGSLNTIEGRKQCNDKSANLHYVDRVRFNNTGSVATIKGAEFTSIDYGLSGPVVASIPRPHRMHLERTKI